MNAYEVKAGCDIIVSKLFQNTSGENRNQIPLRTLALNLQSRPLRAATSVVNYVNK